MRIPSVWKNLSDRHDWLNEYTNYELWQ